MIGLLSLLTPSGAPARGYARRRLSIESLARFHRACVGNGISGEARLRAREETTMAEVEGLTFGPTFADTLALNRSALDLYEEVTP